MAFCRTVELLYDALPLRPLRSWLIRAHMEKCPRCQARLLSLEEARGLLVARAALGSADSLWPRILAGAGSAEARDADRLPAFGAIGRWASAAAMAIVVAATGFWLLREVGRSGFDRGAIPPVARFEIRYVNVGGEPAQTFVYQPQGSDTVFVWAQKNP